MINRRNEDRVFFALEDGFGRIEVVAYSDALHEYGALLEPDALVLVEGHLHEDRFNGGTALRLRRAWPVEAYCASYGQRLRLTLDGTMPDAAARLLAVIAPFRGGQTAVTIEVVTATAQGILDSTDALHVRSEPALIEALRACPGISEVKLRLARPGTADSGERQTVS